MSADFYDSNVFVYLFDGRDQAKQAKADTLVRSGIESSSACISFQVVQETVNIVTRKLSPPVSAEDAKRLVRSLLMPLCRVMPSSGLYTRALDLQGRLGYTFYDSLIVAAALEAGCTRLFSEDLQRGQVIDTLRIENPFSA